MLFATALTSTVMVICAAPRATNGSPNTEIVLEEVTLYRCNNVFECPSEYGFTRCENHLCMCDENSYQVSNDTSGFTFCHLCAMFQESCSVKQCCQNPKATTCVNGVCMCRPGMEEECLGRYTPTLGIQLANTLSVSFAFVFLAITFIAVIRKTLFRCRFCRCDSLSRVSSDSSLNEFIKHKMQNRPPCYDDIEKDRKVPIDTCCLHQPPPEYGAMHFGRASRGVVNAALSISDEVDMNTAPPNYSTFTTITDVNAAAAAATTTTTTASVHGRAGNSNDNNYRNEIILTQPIYMNRDSCLRYT